MSEKKKDYEHLCNNQEEHRLYHAIGCVCPCPQPCEKCGRFDLDKLHYSPDHCAVIIHRDWTPMWLCTYCGGGIAKHESEIEADSKSWFNDLHWDRDSDPILDFLMGDV